MGNIIIPKNYPAFMHARDINELCAPLLSNSNIDMCVFVRVYEDGSSFALNTYAKFEECMLLKYKGEIVADWKYLTVISKNPRFSKNRYNKVIWFANEVLIGDYWDSIFKMLNLEISNFLFIAEKFLDYYELFIFAPKLGESISGFCVNHYNVLENFMLYFKEYGADLINKGEKNKVVLPGRNQEYKKMLQNLEESTGIEKNCITNLNDKFKLRKYSIDYNGIKAHITSRELECLQYISRGYSCKEIGDIMQVSPRTVEIHLQNTKNKLDVSFKSELLKIYRSSLLENLV